MNLDNELDEKNVEALICSVKKRYDIPQKYYQMKKESCRMMNCMIMAVSCSPFFRQNNTLERGRKNCSYGISEFFS